MMTKRAIFPLWSVLGLLWLLPQPGCEEPNVEAKIFEACDDRVGCGQGLDCLKTVEGAKVGICVKECKRDADCGKDLRCTGRWQRHAEAVATFCRKPVVELGGDCSTLPNGCLPGTRCFKGRCVGLCKANEDCASKNHVCVPVVVDRLLDKARTELYRACLPAMGKHGHKCTPIGPFCARGHYCYDTTCVQVCGKDADCGKGRICDGQLYIGEGAEKRAKAKAKGDRQFCRKAAKRNRPCHRNLHIGCVRGLECVKFHCRKVRHFAVGHACDPDRGHFCRKGAVCFAGKCHRACLVDEDCPHAAPKRRRRKRGKPLTCQPRTVHKRKVKICL